MSEQGATSGKVSIFHKKLRQETEKAVFKLQEVLDRLPSPDEVVEELGRIQQYARMKKSILEKQVRVFLEEMIEEFEKESLKKAAKKQRVQDPKERKEENSAKKAALKQNRSESPVDGIQEQFKNGDQSLLNKRDTAGAGISSDIIETLKSSGSFYLFY